MESGTLRRMADVMVVLEELAEASRVLRGLADEVGALRATASHALLPDSGSVTVDQAVADLVERWQRGLQQLAADSLELAGGLEAAGARYLQTEAAVSSAAGS